MFHCFLRFGCGDAFLHQCHKQTTLRPETCTQSSFYAQILLHREVCAQKSSYTQTPLHTEAFTQRSFYTQKFLHTDALHKNAFACISKGTQALLHTAPFTQRDLCTEQLLHKETFTQESFDTHTHAQICPHRLHKEVFYTPKLLHAKSLPRAACTHRNFSAQKPLRTEVFMHSSLYTDAFTHKLVHTARFYTASFYMERLCFPFLITYLSGFPLPSMCTHIYIHMCVYIYIYMCVCMCICRFEP